MLPNSSSISTSQKRNYFQNYYISVKEFTTFLYYQFKFILLNICSNEYCFVFSKPIGEPSIKILKNDFISSDPYFNMPSLSWIIMQESKASNTMVRVKSNIMWKCILQK